MYAAARQSRLTGGWTTSTSTADGEILASLTSLRDRSRALIRDAAYAKRARVIVVNNVIGSGMGLQGQVKSTRNRLQTRVNSAIEQAWESWSKADSCHTGGSLHFSDFERLVMGEVFEAGEVFIRQHFTYFGGSKVPYALELIESERVPHDQMLSIASTGNEIRMGVEVDKFMRPVAYWIRNRAAADYQFLMPRGNEEVERVPAEEIIHLRIIERWPQTRGVPWLHAVARKLNDMDGYSEAEIVAARAASNYVGAYEGTTEWPAPDSDRQDDGTYETELTPGIILTPPAGKKFSLYSPNRPNTALDPFMRYMLREVAAGIGVSYESLSRDYSQSNYSSSRLALLDDRDLWRVLQTWFIRAFRDVVHRAWLQQAVLAKAIQGISVEEFALNREKFEAVKYKPRGWSWVDPTKEVQAYKEAEKAGYVTKTQIIAQTAGGQDFEDVMEERRQELDVAAEMGLKFDTDPGAQAQQPAQADQSSADQTDNAQEDAQPARSMRVVR